VLDRLGWQPSVIQTDRGPCFVGTDGGASRAAPGRLTLWLWGLGIEHRLIPVGKPQRNGVVERFHGAMERSWTGEPDGLEALTDAWHQRRPAIRATPTPYRGQVDFRLERVWGPLERVQVERCVSRQGKLSLWDRDLHVGRWLADRQVVVSVDAARQRVVVRDKRHVLLAEVAVPWLPCTWIWTGQVGADLASASTNTTGDTATCP
jgi:hypothetical protein